MSVSRDDLQKNIFSKLENFVTNKECDYQFDIQKCYIDYQEEDKKYISTIKHFKEQEFIPNARFSMGEYKDDKILIIIGEQEIEINDEVLTSIEIDLPIFLYGIYELNGQVNYGKSPMAIYNDILCQPEDDEYTGHKLEDLQDSFENIVAYKMGKNSSWVDEDMYAAYAYYLLKKLQEKSGEWDNNTLDAVERVLLTGNDKIPYHNIALALLSNQWNHIFLESYRCIEHLFQIIKLDEFHAGLQTQMSLIEFSKQIEEKISWRPNEENAIEEIFKQIENQNFTRDLEKVKGKEKEVQGMKLHKWYYQKRNSIAHYRAVHEPVKLDAADWNTMIKFNFEVIEYLYDKYKKKL